MAALFNAAILQCYLFLGSCAFVEAPRLDLSQRHFKVGSYVLCSKTLQQWMGIATLALPTLEFFGMCVTRFGFPGLLIGVIGSRFLGDF